MSDHSNLGTTFGAAFLGGIVAAVLFGITNLQTYIYFSNYHGDWRFQKFAVAALWILDALHLATITHAIYYYLVISYGEFEALVRMTWSLKLEIALNVVIVVIVQALYAARLWTIGRYYHRILPWGIVIVIIAGGSIGTLLVVQTYRMVHEFEDISRISLLVKLCFACSTLIDFIIAISMCLYLQKSRSGLSFSNTNSTILTLMRYIIISGLATSICSTIGLITYIIMPQCLIFLSLGFLLTKLYINSYLAMLTARGKLRERSQSDQITGAIFRGQSVFANGQRSSFGNAESHAQTRSIPHLSTGHVDGPLTGSELALQQEALAIRQLHQMDPHYWRDSASGINSKGSVIDKPPLSPRRTSIDKQR